jgi:ribosomal protein S18 acetylase RimI-like enzyme
MASVACRTATRGDAAFLARAMQEADRGHTGIGSWDIVFAGSEDRRLDALARLAATGPRSHVHWSKFTVAEVDGRPVAAAAGYVPDETPPRLLLAAAAEAQVDDGARANLVAEGASRAWSREYFAVELPGDTLRVEWVYTAPDHRGRAICGQLLCRLFDAARDRGIASAHVATYIGNEPAIAAYRRAGFQPFAECRHADYERRFGAPGLTFLRRSL